MYYSQRAKFCNVSPNICGCWGWNCLRVISLAPMILKLRQVFFWEGGEFVHPWLNEVWLPPQTVVLKMEEARFSETFRTTRFRILLALVIVRLGGTYCNQWAWEGSYSVWRHKLCAWVLLQVGLAVTRSTKGAAYFCWQDVCERERCFNDADSC